MAAAIVRAARLTREDAVLEIGPGLGVLTERLVALAAHVVAIEIDPILAEWLRGEFASLEVITADVLTVDLDGLVETPFVAVANLPYHITSPAVRRLLATRARRLVVMVQAEVAARMTARPGDLSALGVIVQAQARAYIARKVSKAAFYPSPRVDSAVVVMDPERQVAPDEIAAFEDLVHAGFKQPRKTLANSLSDGLSVSKSEAVALLERAGIDASLRPQALAVADWLTLYGVSR